MLIKCMSFLRPISSSMTMLLRPLCVDHLDVRIAESHVYMVRSSELREHRMANWRWRICKQCQSPWIIRSDAGVVTAVVVEVHAMRQW
jgi:hypothetical protein